MNFATFISNICAIRASEKPVCKPEYGRVRQNWISIFCFDLFDASCITSLLSPLPMCNYLPLIVMMHWQVIIKRIIVRLSHRLYPSVQIDRLAIHKGRYKAYWDQNLEWGFDVQCDQIWRNFATATKLWANFDSLFLIWQNVEHTLANLVHYWANFHNCLWPNIEK